MHPEPCVGCSVPIGPDDVAVEAVSAVSDAPPTEALLGSGFGPFFFHPDHWDAALLDPRWSWRAGPKPLRELPGYL
jgi:hypothetical protein